MSSERSESAGIGATLWISACLVVPGIAEVERYLGPPAVAAYVLAVPLAIQLIRSRILPWVQRRLIGRRLLILELSALAGVIAAFAYLFPIADAHKHQGMGTDRDDALNIAVDEIAHGRYPYHARTYFDSPISPMPGAILLAAPFRALGNAAYQNIFWLLMLHLLLIRHFRCRQTALAMTLSMLLLCPTALRDLLNGSDLLANNIYVAGSIWFLLRRARDADGRFGACWPAALLLGVTLSSRANFLFLSPVIIARLFYLIPPRRAIALIAAVTGVFCAVTVPFLLHDPANFTPAHAVYLLRGLSDRIAFAQYGIPAAMGVLALLASRRRIAEDQRMFWGGLAMIQAVPVLCGIGVEILRGSANTGRPLGFAAFGLNLLVFGLLAGWSAGRPQATGRKASS